MDLPIKVEGIVYAKEGKGLKFLIIKRVPEDGGFWQPLTESLEESETVENCIRRGMKEELGVNKIISITERVWSFAWENKHGEPNIDLVYGVEIPITAEIIINPDEHTAYKWVSFNKAIELLEIENNKNAFKKLKETA